jgi:DNA helicase HerA-like ATPase
MRDVVLIFGRTGSGKTELAKKIIPQYQDKYDRVIILDPNGEYTGGTVVFSYAALIEAVLEGTQFIIFRMDNFDECESVYELVFNAPDTLLVLDEAEMFISKVTNARDSYFHRIVAFGRHRNLGLLAIGRRVVELNIYLRAQYTTIATFEQKEPRDLALLEEYGFNVAQIRGLEQYDFAYVGNELPGATGIKSSERR